MERHCVTLKLETSVFETGEADMTVITEKAMLARLKVSRWGASKHDKDISAQVAQQFGADPKMGRYSKKLIAAEQLETIRQISRRARRHHYQNTLPWLDDGARILPASLYFDYMAAQNAFKAEFDQAARQFCDEYPDHVKQAERLLGGAFKAAEYPSEHRVKEMFSITCEVEQMPNAEDFRVALSEDENERIREQIRERLQTAVDGAMADVWHRVNEQV